MPSNSSRQTLSWLMCLVSALIAIAWFLVPAFIIRPFHHQAPGALTVAMALRQRGPWVTLCAAVVCLFFAFVLWRSAGLWRRIALVLVMVLAAFSALMARMNYFEWMFHPIDSAQFEAEADSKLDAGEMILAVRFGQDARAYPIRAMAYHHILNDVVEGIPVAVTY